MKSSPKVVVVMPAHNAARTLARSIARLPRKFIDQIILVDDASTDNTFEIARKLSITAFKNQINLGYGGNLKVCLTKALEAGADIIIEFHPDNQYDPESLPLFLKKAEQGYDFALGSRFIHPKEALKRHMPLAKFIANRALSFIDEFVLGIELSEFHSGFRLYTKKLLQTVPYLQNSDDYLFSFEIIVQAVYFKFKVAEVQISCDYHPAMHTANLRRSSVYAIGTFKTLGQYILAKYTGNITGPFHNVKTIPCPLCKQKITRFQYVVKDAVSGKLFNIYYCPLCQIAFTLPQPTNYSKFYTKTYYSKIKTILYDLLQFRRPEIIEWYRSRGAILDIGCGDGAIGYKLIAKGYHYQGIETPFANITNPLVKSVGIEKLAEKDKSYDVVTFWESFEHIPDPQAALTKAYKALNKGGVLIIECPNYDSFERYIFGNRWFHLDPPRHLFHYRQSGLRGMIEAKKFYVLLHRLVYAPEYIPVGLAQSFLYRLSTSYNVFARNSKTPTYWLLPLTLFILAVIMMPISIFFYILKGSPIQLIVAKKEK